MLRVALWSLPTLSRAVCSEAWVTCPKETLAQCLNTVLLLITLQYLLAGTLGKRTWLKNSTQWAGKSANNTNGKWNRFSNYLNLSSISCLWHRCLLDNKPLLNSSSKPSTNNTEQLRVTLLTFKKVRATQTVQLISRPSRLLPHHPTKKLSSNSSQEEIVLCLLATPPAHLAIVPCPVLRTLTVEDNAIIPNSWKLIVNINDSQLPTRDISFSSRTLFCMQKIPMDAVNSWSKLTSRWLKVCNSSRWTIKIQTASQ